VLAADIYLAIVHRTAFAPLFARRAVPASLSSVSSASSGLAPAVGRVA
jgi:hypothetical protein